MTKNEVKDLEEHKFVDTQEEDEGGEVAVPELDEEETDKVSKEESESSTDEEEEEESEDEESKEEAPVPSQPKPVEGETPREKALRKEVQRLKGQRREARIAEKDAPAPIPTVDLMKELEDDYTPEELTKMSKVVKAVVAGGGYVKKSEAQESTANDVLNDFLDDHTEYSPQNDVEDIKWNAFQRILGEDYNVKNKSPRQLKAIFSKVHRDVNEEFGIVEDTPVHNEKKLAAQKQKIQSVSHTGGTKTKSIKKSGKTLESMDDGTRKMFKGGWNEDDF